MSAAAQAPLDARFLDRPLYLAARVKFWMHLAAWWAAGGDGRYGVLSALDSDRMDPLFTTPGAPADVETFWIARNRAGFSQADERDFRAMAARFAPCVRDLGALVDRRSLHVLERDVEEKELERLSGRTKPELTTIQRGPAEVTAHPGVVLSRRMRAWQAPVSATEARIAAIDAAIRQIDSDAAPLAAILETAFGVALTRSRGLREHYERCAETYRRRLTHRHKGGATFQAAAMATTTIPVPTWNAEPNPWIPATYLKAGSVNSTEEKNHRV